MGDSRNDAAARRVRGEGRVLELLAADGAPVTGTLDRLGHRFGLAPDELRACLLELARAGWISILILPFGRVTIRVAYEPLEDPPVRAVGLRAVPHTWRL